MLLDIYQNILTIHEPLNVKYKYVFVSGHQKIKTS
jgi:hypothetical protein